MTFDLGGFLGGIVGVMGTYMIFRLQRKADLEKMEPQLRKLQYQMKSHYKNAIFGLIPVALDYKEKSWEEFTKRLSSEVLDPLGKAQELAVELGDQAMEEKVGAFLKQIVALSFEDLEMDEDLKTLTYATDLLQLANDLLDQEKVDREATK